MKAASTSWEERNTSTFVVAISISRSHTIMVTTTRITVTSLFSCLTAVLVSLKACANALRSWYTFNWRTQITTNIMEWYVCNPTEFQSFHYHDNFLDGVEDLTNQSVKDFLVICPVSASASKGYTIRTSSLIMNLRSSSSSMYLFIMTELFRRNKRGKYHKKGEGQIHFTSN